MERKKHNSGIALVMVLGILSVMVIMAVAFAISMRTERVAAGNYADSVRARHLVHVGIARALDDLAGQLGPNGLMSAGGGTNYPPWFVTNSYTTNYVNTSTNKLYLLTGKATNFVPRALWVAAINADCLNATNHWLPLDSLIYTNNAGIQYLVESNRMGRVKYLILNCSGLLDANFVGGNTLGRGLGHSPDEISIDKMPEFNNATTFITNRAGSHIRYETLHEFSALNPAAFNGYPSNFVVYSYNRMGYWDAVAKCVATQVNLSGTSEELKLRKDAIINAFVKANYLATEAGNLYSNLIDYADMDSIPGNLHTCVENVPMINEVVFSNNVIALPSGNIVINNSVFIELWTPFVVSNESQYQFNVQVNYGSTFINGSNSTPIPINATRTFTNLPCSFTTLMFSVSQVPVTNMGIPIVCTATVFAAEVHLLSGTKVDELASGSMISISTNPVNGFTENVYECLDPRLNYGVAQWYWKTNNINSLGQENSITLSYLGGLNDGDTAMYVDTSEPADIQGNPVNIVIVSGLRYYRTGTPVVFDGLLNTSYTYYTIMPNSSQPNTIQLADTYEKAVRNEPKLINVSGQTRIKPAIQSAGELGYIYLGYPWQTVKLYGNTMKEVLKTFAVYPQITFTVDHVPGHTVTISNSPSAGSKASLHHEGLPVTVSSSGIVPAPLVVNKIYYVTNCVSDIQFELFDPSLGAVVTFINFGQETHTINPTYVLPESSGRGMVNINSLNDAMYSVFADVVLEPYPNTPEEVFTVLANNILKVPGNRAYFTGSPVKVLSTINSLPAGLSSGQTYYAILVSASEIKLADTYPNAMNNQPITITGAGGGVLKIKSSKLSFDDAIIVANSIMTGMCYTNISEVGKTLVYNTSITIGSEIIKESIIRNTCGLMNVRQNLFTIIIEAQVASGGNIPRNPVRQRAVFLVWSDPYTGEMFYRNIIWLGD